MPDNKPRVMPKVLNGPEFTALTHNANSFTAIVTAIVENSDGKLSAEDISTDLILDMISSSESEAALTAKLGVTEKNLEAKTTELAIANDENTKLKNEVKALKELPAGDTSRPKAEKEPNAKPVDIADFANEKKGDTQAIVAQAIEEGFL